MKEIKSKFPVDTIIVSDELIYGSYYHAEGERKGELVFYNLKNDTNKCIPTTGTLSIKKYENLVYAANCNNISVYSDKFLSNYENSQINCDISVDKFVCATNTEGELQIFDKNLSLLQKNKLSVYALWSVDQNDSLIITGGEEGKLFLVDPRSRTPSSFSTRMLCSVRIKDNYIYTGDYDGYISIFDIRMNKVSEYFVEGQIWKIKFYQNFIVLSCMHEGVKVLNSDFMLLHKLKPSSMVYDAEIQNNFLFYTSFYENKIYKSVLNKK